MGWPGNGSVHVGCRRERVPRGAPGPSPCGPGCVSDLVPAVELCRENAQVTRDWKLRRAPWRCVVVRGVPVGKERLRTGFRGHAGRAGPGSHTGGSRGPFCHPVLCQNLYKHNEKGEVTHRMMFLAFFSLILSKL